MENNSLNLQKKRAKYSNEFKLYVIIYMREHFLSNKEAARLFLPNQNGSSAKTIREWTQIYDQYGPLGFFKMDIEKRINELKEYMPEPIDMDSLKDKSKEELLDVIYQLDLKRCVKSAMYEELKKKVNKSSQIQKRQK